MTTHLVKMAVSLPMTKEAFNVDEQKKFKKSIAAAAGVSNDDVTIDNIVVITTSRRRLLGASIRVDTSVKAKDKSSADALGAKLTVAAINSELAKEGLPAATMLESPKTVEANPIDQATLANSARLSTSFCAVTLMTALVAIAALY